ncbi:MAG: glycosyltransferase [Chitinophagaceae bacterium]|nr:MAG: glycosyltransferase [Chitinophagaceae bacterium]
MNDIPFVTIVVISFNHENFIERCLRSVIFQSYRDFQLLYLDNASADKTFEKATSILKDSGIHYIAEKSPENLGAAKGNNYLLDKYQPQGRYITLMAGDDWLDMDNFLYKVQYIKENPQFGMVYGNGYNYDNATEELSIFYKTPSISGWILKELLEAPNINPEGIFYKSEIFRELGYFDPNAKVEDRDLWYRIARVAPIGYVHKPLTFYRVNHSGNISRNLQYMREGNEYFFKKYEKEFPKEIAMARKRQWQYFAYHLATKEPGMKALKFMVKNYKADWLYNKQIIKCMLNMVKR